MLYRVHTHARAHARAHTHTQTLTCTLRTYTPSCYICTHNIYIYAV